MKFKEVYVSLPKLEVKVMKKGRYTVAENKDEYVLQIMEENFHYTDGIINEKDLNKIRKVLDECFKDLKSFMK